ncbi:hypothetical protein GA0115252_178211 [Streptomyces sp. DfronAA-171]|nr:hypothetical protein GA0115252_178211 [Streptomyces sp. DfronAA-171]
MPLVFAVPSLRTYAVHAGQDEHGRARATIPAGLRHPPVSAAVTRWVGSSRRSSSYPAAAGNWWGASGAWRVLAPYSSRKPMSRARTAVSVCPVRLVCGSLPSGSCCGPVRTGGGVSRKRVAPHPGRAMSATGFDVGAREPPSGSTVTPIAVAVRGEPSMRTVPEESGRSPAGRIVPSTSNQSW